MKHLQREFERKRKELEEKAGSERSWAVGLAFVPIVNMIVSPLSLAAAEEDLAESVAKGCEAQMQEVVAAVSNTLIPALKGFISGISRAAGFFSVMEQELKKVGRKR